MQNFPVWLFGLPNSGKSVLAGSLSRLLARKKVAHELLDGDLVRAFFANDLGYSADDRRRNIRRIMFATHLLAKHGVPVIVANVLPFEDMRRELREKIPQARQVYLRASLEACRSRDSTKKALQGATDTFGRSLTFEEPAGPDFVVDTESQPMEDSFHRLLDYLQIKD
jgi:adenylylsulfate kinase